MKEKILDYVSQMYEKLYAKYGWKLWACLAIGVLFACAGVYEGFSEDGLKALLYFIPFFFMGVLSPIVVYWYFKFLWKFCKWLGKALGIAGKGAVKGSVMVGKAALTGSAAAATSGNDNSRGNNCDYSDLKPKEVRRVFTMHYIGLGNRSDCPKFINVPSQYSNGRPRAVEIEAALRDMGYGKSLAHELAAGGSNLVWEVWE